uniref:RING-type domain-containing protein n=1 Tax=Parastrongyloides trichosuri TaxID=131310 RepID=A0A0N5A334_PARTI
MSLNQKTDTETGKITISRPSSRSSPALVALQVDQEHIHSDGYIAISVSDDTDIRDLRRNPSGVLRASSLTNISNLSSEETFISQMNHAGTVDWSLPLANRNNESDNDNRSRFSNERQNVQNISTNDQQRHNIFRDSLQSTSNDEMSPLGTSLFGFVASSLGEVYTNRGQFSSSNQPSDQGDDIHANNPRTLLQIRRNGVSHWVALALPFLALAFFKVFMDNYLNGIGLVLTVVSQKMAATKFVNKSSKKLTIFMIIGTLFRIWFCITWFQLEFMLHSIRFEDQISNWPPVNFFTTLFVTFVTDLFLIDIILIIKMMISLVPYVQPHKIRFMYQWIEMTGRIYAHILPMPQWIVFFETIFYQIGYVAIKINFSMPIFYDFWMCTKNMFSPTPFPSTKPAPEEISIDSQCGICCSPFTSPIKLDCNHIFCKECISTWLDRKDTCPLCRTMINTFKNEHKDGQTTFLHSLF